MMLLRSHFVVASVFAAAALVVVGDWHTKEPQEG